MDEARKELAPTGTLRAAINFGNPVLTASPTSTTFGQISSTRGAIGDAGSSRQLQFAAKVTF